MNREKGQSPPTCRTCPQIDRSLRWSLPPQTCIFPQICHQGVILGSRPFRSKFRVKEYPHACPCLLTRLPDHFASFSAATKFPFLTDTVHLLVGVVRLDAVAVWNPVVSKFSMTCLAVKTYSKSRNEQRRIEKVKRDVSKCTKQNMLLQVSSNNHV